MEDGRWKVGSVEELSEGWEATLTPFCREEEKAATSGRVTGCRLRGHDGPSKGGGASKAAAG